MYSYVLGFFLSLLLLPFLIFNGSIYILTYSPIKSFTASASTLKHVLKNEKNENTSNQQRNKTREREKNKEIRYSIDIYRNRKFKNSRQLATFTSPGLTDFQLI